ncbi:MAG: histidine phosphatase family protein [Methanobacteriota archaeon]
MKLYLARHGESEGNVLKLVQGQGIDKPLTARGRTQAEALARRFAAEPIEAVYASPQGRAQETAQAVARAKGLSVVPREELKELSWGIFEGQIEVDQVAAAMGRFISRWGEGEWHLAPPDGESARGAADRMGPFLAALAARHAGSVVVVSHGRILKIVIAHLLSRRLAEIERIGQSNTGVSLLRHDGAAFRAEYVNDTSHILTK